MREKGYPITFKGNIANYGARKEGCARAKFSGNVIPSRTCPETPPNQRQAPHKPPKIPRLNPKKHNPPGKVGPRYNKIACIWKNIAKITLAPQKISKFPILETFVFLQYNKFVFFQYNKFVSIQTYF